MCAAWVDVMGDPTWPRALCQELDIVMVTGGQALADTQVLEYLAGQQAERCELVS